MILAMALYFGQHRMRTEATYLHAVLSKRTIIYFFSTIDLSHNLYLNNIYTVTNGALWRDMSLGTSSLFPSANIMGWTSNNLLPESGQLSTVFLLIPAAVGAAVVGSFERRISLWLKDKKAKGKRTD